MSQKRLSRSKTKAGRNVVTCSRPTLLFARLIALSLRCFAQSLPLRYAAVPCRKVSTSSVKANALSCITTKAIKNYWKTSTSGSITLKKENPEVFEVYLNWLYGKTLPVHNDSLRQEGNIEYVQLAKVYVLGEMPQDVNSKTLS